MGILFGSTPAARKDSSHHQDMPYIFMSWFPERNLGLDPRLAFSIRTGTWLDFFWRGGRHACWNPRSSSEKTDDSPFGFIRLAMEVILCFFWWLREVEGFRCPKFRASYSNDSNMGLKSSSDYGTRYQVPVLDHRSNKVSDPWRLFW